MSVIHGRFVGRNDREFVLRTGRDDETTGGGRIYAVSEEAAANLRRIMAERKANEAQAHRQNRPPLVLASVTQRSRSMDCLPKQKRKQRPPGKRMI